MKNANVTGILLAFLGGIVGAYVLVHMDHGGTALPAASAAATLQQNIVTARDVRLVDATGKVRAELTLAGDGDPALFFFDREGRNRMVLGLYSPAEGELPFVVLNDTKQHAAGIFRLFGARETPVVVLKNEGQDRSIYGLNPSSTDPFIVNIAPDGKKNNVFGNY